MSGWLPSTASTGTTSGIKLYVAEARQRLARDDDTGGLQGLHRRFEVVAGAQAQVDWGDEGAVLLGAGIVKVYSFHMTLSYSRDPFCCFVTSQDLGTFFDCHRRAFAHFGGYVGVGPTIEAPGGPRWRRSSTWSANAVDAVLVSLSGPG